MTPKGFDLADHFGANPFSNVYGPRPRIINRDAFIKNPDGTVSRKRIRLVENAGMSVSDCDIT